MRHILGVSVLAAAAALAFAASSAQQDEPAQSSPPAGAQTTRESPVYAGRAVTLHGTIESVDRVTRTVSVRGDDGRITMIRLNDNTADLDGLAKGSKVTARYQEAMLLSIARSDASPQVQSQTSQETPSGGTPAMQAVEHTSVVAQVTDVDREANRLTLETPNGQEIHMTARDAKALEDLKTGDKVVATYIEAFALSIAPQDAPATAREAPDAEGARQRQ